MKIAATTNTTTEEKKKKQKKDKKKNKKDKKGAIFGAILTYFEDVGAEEKSHGQVAHLSPCRANPSILAGCAEACGP